MSRIERCFVVDRWLGATSSAQSALAPWKYVESRYDVCMLPPKTTTGLQEIVFRLSRMLFVENVSWIEALKVGHSRSPTRVWLAGVRSITFVLRCLLPTDLEERAWPLTAK